jgi:hypothetical protein
VDVAHHVRVQAVARGFGVSGVRPAPGDHRAEVDDDDQRGEREAGECDRSGRHGCAAGPADENDEQHRSADQHHREEEVQRDDPRVEVGEHGDATDDALERDAECEHDRQPARRG